MVKRMLIDGTQPEETRVVVVSGKKLEEFDFESVSRKPLKGNIYLAKVTRVEPSLQAAFVDYGGNRHGFLAFNEIHPDYYKVPVADQQQAEQELVEEAEAAEAAEANDESGEGNGKDVEEIGGDEEEEIEEIRPSSRARHERRYKIQEVIKKRQVILVQVTKEERGNTGAALTTYLSLAGRYCVLMPNTARGGGISRKVTQPSDRKRLKKIMEDLGIPTGLAVILRTAGVKRTKAEIKRDYEYLVKVWSEIREETLKSTAPNLIYEEGNLIKRAIRDLYSNEITEVMIEGDEAYRTAKDFMKMLIPSHAKKVQPYKDEGMPLFHRYQIESQIDNIHNPVAHLKSGGYIVIDSTEALVAIDVNSGRSTRERNIEETAYRTNLEASEEVARQLRLRDLAGLIVIDYIDMDENRNNLAVEARLKESMRQDRARIQVGRISHFGLLELSRQRLRPSLFETSMEACSACGGTGHIRSTESMALHTLRQIEDEALRKPNTAFEVICHSTVALYLLNHKRQSLAEMEAKYGLRIVITGDDTLTPSEMRIETIATLEPGEGGTAPVRAGDLAFAPDDEDEGKDDEKRDDQPRSRGRRGGRGRGRGRDDDGNRGRRPDRAAKDAGEGDGAGASSGDGGDSEDESRKQAAAPNGEDGDGTESGQPRKRRRRGKRGGRRRNKRAQEAADGNGVDTEAQGADEAEAGKAGDDGTDSGADDGKEAPKPRRGRRRKADAATETEAGEDASAEAPEQPEASARDDGDTGKSKPKGSRRRRSPKSDDDDGKDQTAAAAEASDGRSETAKSPANGGDGDSDDNSGPAPGEEIIVVEEDATPGEPRKGWWRSLVE